MIRLRLSLELDYEVFDPGCDFIFNIHAAHTDRQRVIEESLTRQPERGDAGRDRPGHLATATCA